MADEKFKSGDVVRLKSGGPKMTAGGYSMSSQVICRWFDGTKPMSDTFDEDSLDRVDPRKAAAACDRCRAVAAGPGVRAPGPVQTLLMRHRYR